MAESDELRKDLDRLKADLDTLRSDIGEVAGALRDLGAERWHGARDSAEDELRRAREVLERRADEARARGREARDAAERQVSEHPLGSLLTAFGVGFALAKLLDMGRR